MFLKIRNKEWTEIFQRLKSQVIVYDYRYKIAFDNVENLRANKISIVECARKELNVKGYIELQEIFYKNKYYGQLTGIKLIIADNRIEKE